MTFQEIEKLYEEQTIVHRKMYEDALINVLKSLDLYEKDVFFEGKKGRLIIVPSGYDLISFEIKFRPYKKDGTLGKNYNNIFWYRPSEDELKSKLKMHITINAE